MQRIKVLITGGNGDIAKAVKKKMNETEKYLVRSPGKEELDVTDIESINKFLTGFVPDILINNAGFVVPQSIKNCDLEIEEKSIQINLQGVFNCTGAVLKRNKNAQIINIGSSAATKLHGTWSSYCASKAAVVMATQCWALDGVNAVCISPGRTATKMRANLYPDEDKSTLLKPEDFAKIIIYAAEGLYTPGSHINVNLQNIEELIKKSMQMY